MRHASVDAVCNVFKCQEKPSGVYKMPEMPDNALQPGLPRDPAGGAYNTLRPLAGEEGVAGSGCPLSKNSIPLSAFEGSALALLTSPVTTP